MQPQIPEFTPSGNRDTLFHTTQYPRRFQFDAEVAKVFDDMISRSVPLYREVLKSVAIWTHRFYQPGTTIYDIGCSTGSTIKIIAEYLDTPATIVGIDTSDSMLEEAREKLKPYQDAGHKISFHNANASDFEYSKSSVVIMNYTLQFIPIAQRLPLLKKISQSLESNGLLYLSEKLRSPSALIQESLTDIYEYFKESNGYSRTEIERKKEALDNVLIPLTAEEQMQLLRKSGFDSVEPILRWNNFCSFVSLKHHDE